MYGFKEEVIFNQGLEIIEVEERVKSILSSVNSMCKESKNKYQVVRTPCVCVWVCVEVVTEDWS